MRKTKIVCTIGPASEDIATLKKMMLAGMNVARLNFSHGNQEEHAARIKAIRQAAQELDYTIGILLDTKGPEIRIGQLAQEILLQEGQELTLTTRQLIGNEKIISVNYPGLPADVKEGDAILLADGLIELEVLKVQDTDILCKVLNSGRLTSNKGVNVPGVNVSLPFLTNKDLEDIRFGMAQKLDFIAPSFIRNAEDVLQIRRILEENGSDMQIIAKIENRAAVENFNEILRVSDGIMVARGDLGVEISAEEVPIVQKSIIAKCNKVGKPVIIATQMLDSMERNPRPTRAEASDVANAIFDGTDAVMLSGESAAGKYPVEAVATMARIAEKTERVLNYAQTLKRKQDQVAKTVTDSIGYATANMALDLEAAAIITPTASGSTARMVAKYRPKAPIIATTSRASVAPKLTLVWGVVPLMVPESKGTDEMINVSVEAALNHQKVKPGDLVIVTAGVPVGIPGTTNLLKVHVVGEAVVKGQGIGQTAVSGKVQVCFSAKEALAKINEGDVLVTRSTHRDYLPAMEKAAAIITEEGGLTSHAAIVGLNLGKPVIVGATGALRLLEEGLIVTVDSTCGLVYKGGTKVK